ncbi:MAG: 3'-5' exonuclease [Arsenophonus sp. NC-CH8-MAG3]
MWRTTKITTILKILLQNRILYRILRGALFFLRSDIKDTLTYLRIFTYLSDDIAFLRIINIPKYEIRLKSIQELCELSIL